MRTKNRKDILFLIKRIGFKYDSKYQSGIGRGIKYKYYQYYLKDYHYTVVFFF